MRTLVHFLYKLSIRFDAKSIAYQVFLPALAV